MPKGSDQIRSLYVEQIESHSQWVLESAIKVERYVNQLAYRPPYETKAFDQMQKAQMRLAQAARAIELAIKTYEELEERDGPRDIL